MVSCVVYFTLNFASKLKLFDNYHVFGFLALITDLTILGKYFTTDSINFKPRYFFCNNNNYQAMTEAFRRFKNSV